MTRRTGLAALLLSVVVWSACAGPRLQPHAPTVGRVTLLQINDVYELEPVDGGRRGGMARLATLVKRVR